MKNFLIVLFLIGCFGCATVYLSRPSLTHISVFPKQASSSARPTGSIADELGSRLFGHKQSFAVGDVITVVLTESTQGNEEGLEAVKGH